MAPADSPKESLQPPFTNARAMHFTLERYLHFCNCKAQIDSPNTKDLLDRRNQERNDWREDVPDVHGSVHL
jgi:hypothetical protein